MHKGKRIICTVTSGRSGTGYLSYLLSGLPGVASVHEAGMHSPGPGFHTLLPAARHDPQLARQFLLEKKLPHIHTFQQKTYFEASHYFCKGFVEPLLDLAVVPDLILLRRDPRKVAHSWVLIGGSLDEWRKGENYKHLLGPHEPNFLPATGVENWNDYQFCYWYALESNFRMKHYKELIESRGGRTFDTFLQPLIAGDRYGPLLSWLNVPGDIAARRMADKGFRQRKVNDQSREKHERGHAHKLEGLALDALEAQVRRDCGLSAEQVEEVVWGTLASGETGGGKRPSSRTSKASALADAFKDNKGSLPRIFVRIAAFRDPECHPTICDLFAKATYPERVSVGVCWQYDKVADAEYLQKPLSRPDQVRTLHFSLDESQGAGWARNQTGTLWQGEEYSLQIDSHMRFEPGWDEELLAMLGRCESAKPVVTGWLPGYTPPDNYNLQPGKTTRCFVRECNVRNDPQIVHLMYRVVDEADIRLAAPMPVSAGIANFLFARSALFEEVPSDPHIFFWGDEISFSTRAWTRGWDFFQFDRTLLYHYWDRDQKGATEYRNFQNPRNIKTRKRLHHLLGLHASDDKDAIKDLKRYGLGKERTLDEYWRFAGLDMPAGKILPHARRGMWPHLAKPSKMPRIFVQIASYRDPECQHTVKNLFEQAAHPERIFVGICWQYDPEKDQHCFEIACPRPDQVRMVAVHSRDSRGAGWARTNAGYLRRGEEYTLLIDAHMRFEQGWDETLISAIGRAPSDKPVISAYCSGYRPGTDTTDGPERWRIRVNAPGGPKDPQLVHLTGLPASAEDPRGDLYPTPFCVFHLIFAKSEAFEEVPIDPHIMFWGDEITHAARLWTHGYDIFQPDHSLAYHLWERGEEQKSLPYRPLDEPRNRRSAARVRHLFGLAKSADREAITELELYGLGKARSLEGFFKFAGLDMAARTARPASHKGFWFRSPEPNAGKGKIFVSIASYRDPECQHTVADLFAKAKHPENIFVGLCWQYDQDKDQHCFTVPYARPAQVRVIGVDWRETQGVCWARWMTQTLWRGEEYALQIDSHMRFAEGWDEKLVEELRACPSTKPVLSGCIARYTPPGELEPDPKPSVLRAGVFAPDGNIRNRGAFLLENPPQPLPGAFASAGFIFSRSQVLREVPYDPYLSFDQEEIVLSARLYTQGWDVYSSRRPYVYHHYVKPEERVRPVVGEDMRTDGKLAARFEALRRRGLKRMDHLLGAAKTTDKEALRELGLFGLGKVRSLVDYENYCGIDFQQKRVSEYALRARFIPGLLNYVKGVHVPEIDDNLAPVATIMSEEDRVERLKRRAPGSKEKPRGAEKIFVQIASYRDPECQYTVADLFAKAKHPERISVGICWLFDAEEDRRCFELPVPRPEQVRIKRYHHLQTRGINWARAEAQSLMSGEEYTLQADSHMRFTTGWDEALISMLKQTGSQKSAITAVLPGYQLSEALPAAEESLTRLHVQSIVPPLQAAVMLGRTAVQANDRAGLYPTPFVCGSFLFARSQMFADVPVDPYLGPGSVLSYGLRLWTHGYSLFQPDRPVAYHRTENLHHLGLRVVPPGDEPRIQHSFRRARHLLGLEFTDNEESLKDLDRYGHGSERSVDSFREFSGVDLEKGTIAPVAARGEWGVATAPQEPPDKARIFVQIASYRDPECQYTVKELFESAAHPERIFVGIIWQYIKEEDHYCFAVPCPRPEQVRIIHVDARESKGVCWARAQVQELWQGEEYTFQIDSHMRFEPGWDNMLIEQLRACPNPAKAVLTTYPAAYTPPRDIKHRLSYRLIAKDFDSDGIFTMGSRSLPTSPPPEKPVLGAFIGACMLFGPGSIIKDVPYDSRLYFFGEEITLSLRLWTSGYDIYHPTKPIVYHFWERKARRTHFDDYSQWPKLNRLSVTRARHLLGCAVSEDPEVLAGLDAYGLGHVRTLEQYQQFCGVNFARHDISAAALDGKFPADVSVAAKPEGRQAAQGRQGGQGQQRRPQQEKGGPRAQQVPPPKQQVQAQGNGQQNGNGARPASRNSGPRKIMETADVIVYDDFLPQDVYDRLFDFVSQTDYQYINTSGKVKRVWDMTNGHPLRSEKNVFYYAPGTQKPDGHWVYPSKNPFDRFVEHINPMVPEVQHLVGAPGYWEHFSVTSWIYPPGTGLSMHDDGSGVYTGAYVFFMNERWRPHWGGLLIVLDHESNKAIQNRKKEVNSYKFHVQKWLHITEHDEIAMENGLAQCIFPKANRIVFIHPDAFHMVTQVSPVAGDRVRMSLAGFFHRGKNQQGGVEKQNGSERQQGEQQQAQQGQNKPPELY